MRVPPHQPRHVWEVDHFKAGSRGPDYTRRSLDRTTELEGVPDGYRAMNDRDAIKVMITF